MIEKNHEQWNNRTVTTETAAEWHGKEKCVTCRIKAWQSKIILALPANAIYSKHT